MGLDMFMIKRPKGKDVLGYEVGYWRKCHDMHHYFLSRLDRKTEMDDYSFLVGKKDLEAFRDNLIDMIRAYDDKETLDEVYDYYKKVLRIGFYDDYDTEHLSIKMEYILNTLLRTLGIIYYNLETCDFDKYDLYYEYSC